MNIIELVSFLTVQQKVQIMILDYYLEGSYDYVDNYGNILHNMPKNNDWKQCLNSFNAKYDELSVLITEQTQEPTEAPAQAEATEPKETLEILKETQKPDVDLVIYSLDSTDNLKKCLILSLKTSL